MDGADRIALTNLEKSWLTSPNHLGIVHGRESLSASRCGVLISLCDVQAREVFEAVRAEHLGISGKGDLN